MGNRKKMTDCLRPGSSSILPSECLEEQCHRACANDYTGNRPLSMPVPSLGHRWYIKLEGPALVGLCCQVHQCSGECAGWVAGI